MSNYFRAFRSICLNQPNQNNNHIFYDNKRTFAENFGNSMVTENVTIDSELYEVMVKQEKNSENKKIILKPDSKVKIGSIVKIKELSYLIMDFLCDGINEIYPTATLKLCNSIFPISSNKTSDLIGYNDFDEPIYDEVLIEVTSPCVVSNSTQSANTDEPINLPEGQIEVTIPYTESENILEGKEFKMYHATYKIIGIDYTKSINQTGLIIIKGKRV